MNSIVKKIAILLLFQINIVSASWMMVKFINQSDLTFFQAVRANDIVIPSITDILNSGKNPIILSPDALFGSQGGCKIIMKTPQGDQVGFSFFGNPTYRVANGRAMNADIASRNAAANLQSSIMARIFMVQNNNQQKLVGFTGYEQDGQLFALTITGRQGNYAAILTPQLPAKK
ncbi:MAG: hypothetical protein ACXWL2_04455 [Candidatus Chromulinivorax sp.]